MAAPDTKVLQVTNISPSVTMEQLETLFSFLGPIDEMQVFPKTNTIPVSSKVAFIRFQSSSAVATGQHLSHTVFIDKALICVAYNEGIIPDENVAMQYVAPATSESDTGHQIPGNVDPNKVEEIRRTIYVGNLDSKNATAEQLLTFFTTCGEVRFVRMAGDETQPTRFAFVEFADTAAVQNALQLNGMLFGDRPIKVNHSNNAIVKPQGKTQETNAKEIEEAMRRVREAQSLISKALEPEIKEKKRRSRSRSSSRSRHRRRRSRSRSSRRRRSSSRSRRRRRSRSRSAGRSRSRRSRSRSKKRHRRSRSRSPRRSRSRKRERERSSSRKKERSSSRKKERSSSKKRDKERSKSRSRSRSPGKKSSRHKKDRRRDRDRDKSRDRKRRRHSRSRSRSKDAGKKTDENDKKTEGGEKTTDNGKDTPSVESAKAKTEQTSETHTPAAVITNGETAKNGES